MNTHDLVFSPSLPEFFASRIEQPLTVLAGANNSGKSLVLKNLKLVLGAQAYLMGASRFSHIYQIGTSLRDPNALRQWEEQFRISFNDPNYNHEQNYIDLNQILINLPDRQRNRYFALVGQLLGSSISLKRMEQDNELSMRYVDIDGRNMATASTGTRLLMTLVGICCDDRFSTLLIDEPELGLSPRVQHTLARFLQDPDERREHFPHLSQVVIATHSQLLLNRSDIRSNYIVSKSENQVTIEQVQDISAFHKLQFNLLGNSLEDAFLPVAIIVVEGKTDVAYIERLMQLHHPERRITVVSANGNPKERVSSLRDTLGDLEKSPFRDRLFVVMDSVHNYSDKQALIKMGVPAENVAIWDSNGIEYVYPPSIMAEIFASSEAGLSEVSIQSDAVSLNGISLRKIELQDGVIARLKADTPLPPELTSKLLDRVTAVLD